MSERGYRSGVMTIIFLLLLSAVTLLTYSNHFHNAFHFDDSHTIVHNVFIRETSNIPRFFTDGTTFSSLPSNQSYRPLVSTSLAIDYSLGQGLNDTFYFHVSSFAFFLAQVLLMFFVILKIFESVWPGKASFYAAAFATSWYALHPAIAETVNYIIARSDSMSTMLVVLGLLLYIRSGFARKTHLYLLPVLVGCLAKPPAVMFAPILFFYILYFEKKASLFSLFRSSERRLFFESFNRTLPSIIACAVMFVFVQKMEPETWDPGGASRLNYLLTQPYVIAHYALMFFLPVRLSADTDWSPITSMSDPKFFIGMLFIAGLLLIAILTSRKQHFKPISFGIIWYFLALLPSSSVIPLAEVMNDHRLYFPYIGLMISVCWAGFLLLKRISYRTPHFSTYKPSIITVLLLLLGCYAFGTYKRNEVWKTDESLWKDVTEKSPANARGLMNYGLSQMAKGNYPEAEKYFSQGMKLWPRYSYLYINMGILKEATGAKEEAEENFKKGIEYGSHYPNSHFYYGRFLKNNGRLEEAASSLRRSLELSPAQVDARNMLMAIYFDTQNYELLKKEAERALQFNPNDETAKSYLDAGVNKKSRLQIEEEKALANPTADNFLNLSMEFYKAGKYRESISAAEKALSLKPDLAEAYNNIAAAHGALGEWQKEIEMCEKALAINPNLQIAKNNLAWARSQLEKENATK